MDDVIIGEGFVIFRRGLSGPGSQKIDFPKFGYFTLTNPCVRCETKLHGDFFPIYIILRAKACG